MHAWPLRNGGWRVCGRCVPLPLCAPPHGGLRGGSHPRPQACQQCAVVVDADVACVSLDCPVYYERVRAAQLVASAHAVRAALRDAWE
jgi:hypothetical protein